MASPVLSNIYLHKLDVFIETVLIPQYTRGERRARNPAYREVEHAIARARKRGDRTQVRALRKRLHSLPSQDMHDPGYRRLRYLRYADDTLLGFAGPKAEAEEIKQRLAQFLREDLMLEMSPDKTLITHARTGAARFLGYEITVQHDEQQLTRGRRAVNGQVKLLVPESVIKAKSAPYLSRGKPACRNPLVNEADYTIVAKFGAEYRGIVQYYLLAGNLRRLHRLRWVMETSMLKTLAGKHGSSVSKMAARFKAKIATPHGPRTCFEAIMARDSRKELVARFGGIPLMRQKTAVLTDRLSGPVYPHRELIRRILVNRCELCQNADDIEVHHVRSLASLAMAAKPPPQWAQWMASHRRKTLVVCGDCHDLIHHGQPSAAPT